MLERFKNNKQKKKGLSLKGLSLIETLIAISIFMIAAVIGTTILVSIVQSEKRSSIRNAILDDMRVILQQLNNEIQDGTIDYDEYYSVCVIQDACDLGDLVATANYGQYHGVYGSRFYDPGLSTDGLKTFNADDLGVECTYSNPLTGDCEVIYSLSLDLNTGQNPFLGALGKNANDASAFFENGRGVTPDGGSVIVDQLFLLDETGTKKTILARKKVRAPEDWAIGKVVMTGNDTDQNGFMDEFICADGFMCEGGGGTYPSKGDLNKAFYTPAGVLADTEFVPITPLRSSIEDLKFIITPIEDPYKAFSEDAQQSHSSVTIIITVGLSDVAALDYPGVFEPITLQTTVAAGVVGKIDTYPPVRNVRDAGPPVVPSWIDAGGVLPGGFDYSVF